MEKKVLQLEQKLRLIDELPSNQEIINWAQQNEQTDSSPRNKTDKDSILSGVWQFMKINRRLQAAEDGIDRVMSILTDFLGGDGESIKELHVGINDLSDDIKRLKEQVFTGKGIGDASGGSDGVGSSRESGKLDTNTLEALNRLGEFKDIVHDKLSNFVTKDDLQIYVKWPALEEALSLSKIDPKRNKFPPSEVERTSLEGHDIKLPEGVMGGDEIGTCDSEGRPKSAPVPSASQSQVLVPQAPKTALTRSTEVGVCINVI